MGRRRAAEVPQDRPPRMGRGRDLHDHRSTTAVPELLQAPGGADAAGELRGSPRVADPDPGAGRDGSGVVSGWALGVRPGRRRPPYEKRSPVLAPPALAQAAR